MIISGSMPFVSTIFNLPCRYKFVRLLLLSHPEFIQVAFHLLSRSSFSIPTPSPSSILFPSLLPSQTVVMAPQLFHVLASPLTIFSQTQSRHWAPSFSSSRTTFLLCLLYSSAPPSFGGFDNAYSSQEFPYCPVSYFELVESRAVLSLTPSSVRGI